MLSLGDLYYLFFENGSKQSRHCFLKESFIRNIGGENEIVRTISNDTCSGLSLVPQRTDKYHRALAPCSGSVAVTKQTFKTVFCHIFVFILSSRRGTRRCLLSTMLANESCRFSSYLYGSAVFFRILKIANGFSTNNNHSCTPFCFAETIVTTSFLPSRFY